MSELVITPLHADFGARITGLDLGTTLQLPILDKISDAIDKFSFLHFPNQPFDDDRQLEFTKSLGEPEVNHVVLGQEGRTAYFGTIGNVQPDGKQLGNSHARTKFLTGNYMWHSDSSFREIPSFVSIMCAYEVPEEGGDTEFVSTRAAYRRLPDSLKATIDPLVAVHDYVFSRSKVGPDAVSPSLAASLPPVHQKLVRSNPRTGSKNFYVGSHAREIVGWTEAESRSLLDDLIERATQPNAIYMHKWTPGDLVIWDNRCLLHRGTGHDADKHRRYMRQTRVRGAGSTLTE